ncbi:MAG: DUF2177 family protein [Acetobacteraceae bacterium]|nr:DUF2177 family protein [Acetobacteraceae bacterium]
MIIALSWLASLIVFLALDAFWLGIAGHSIYADVLGPLMLDGFRLAPALVFYLLYVTGIAVFVLPLANRRPWPAVAYGAFFGLCAYGTYDLTNHAVLKIWTTRLTVIDMAWGAFVTAAAASAGAWVQRRR